VGQAGADVGLAGRRPAPLATASKAQAYATGQFGKNHLGDLNKYLPTVHGFDEFFGYLYHLDAMSDPYWYSFPSTGLLRQVRPAQPDPQLGDRHRRRDRDAALGQGRQAEDRRRRPAAAVPDMSNVPNMHDLPFQGQVRHDHLRRGAGSWPACGLHGQGKKDRTSRLRLATTPTRMHVCTLPVAKKYRAMMN
jgi:arylsulfatase